ncbi:hypothetical protein E2C01_021288 [Portunus trituberculatus]|uniref:Uncharacterized protein n=1 Tax=Portunus trituberculatus TaxID=210409 RepID=A0A5B7E236_PORTR|nr:hypothetical protein [Portunus trituberculatus]
MLVCLQSTHSATLLCRDCIPQVHQGQCESHERLIAQLTERIYQIDPCAVIPTELTLETTEPSSLASTLDTASGEEIQAPPPPSSADSEVQVMVTRELPASDADGLDLEVNTLTDPNVRNMQQHASTMLTAPDAGVQLTWADVAAGRKSPGLFSQPCFEEMNMPQVMSKQHEVLETETPLETTPVSTAPTFTGEPTAEQGIIMETAAETTILEDPITSTSHTAGSTHRDEKQICEHKNHQQQPSKTQKPPSFDQDSKTQKRTQPRDRRYRKKQQEQQPEASSSSDAQDEVYYDAPSRRNSQRMSPKRTLYSKPRPSPRESPKDTPMVTPKTSPTESPKLSPQVERRDNPRITKPEYQEPLQSTSEEVRHHRGSEPMIWDGRKTYAEILKGSQEMRARKEKQPVIEAPPPLPPSQYIIDEMEQQPTYVEVSTQATEMFEDTPAIPVTEPMPPLVESSECFEAHQHEYEMSEVSSAIEEALPPPPSQPQPQSVTQQIQEETPVVMPPFAAYLEQNNFMPESVDITQSHEQGFQQSVSIPIFHHGHPVEAQGMQGPVHTIESPMQGLVMGGSIDTMSLYTGVIQYPTTTSYIPEGFAAYTQSSEFPQPSENSSEYTMVNNEQQQQHLAEETSIMSMVPTQPQVTPPMMTPPETPDQYQEEEEEEEQLGSEEPMEVSSLIFEQSNLASSEAPFEISSELRMHTDKGLHAASSMESIDRPKMSYAQILAMGLKAAPSAVVTHTYGALRSVMSYVKGPVSEEERPKSELREKPIESRLREKPTESLPRPPVRQERPATTHLLSDHDRSRGKKRSLEPKIEVTMAKEPEESKKEKDPMQAETYIPGLVFKATSLERRSRSKSARRKKREASQHAEEPPRDTEMIQSEAGKKEPTRKTEKNPKVKVPKLEHSVTPPLKEVKVHPKVSEAPTPSCLQETQVQKATALAPVEDKPSETPKQSHQPKAQTQPKDKKGEKTETEKVLVTTISVESKIEAPKAPEVEERRKKKKKRIVTNPEEQEDELEKALREIEEMERSGKLQPPPAAKAPAAEDDKTKKRGFKRTKKAEHPPTPKAMAQPSQTSDTSPENEETVTKTLKTEKKKAPKNKSAETEKTPTEVKGSKKPNVQRGDAHVAASIIGISQTINTQPDEYKETTVKVKSETPVEPVASVPEQVAASSNQFPDVSSAPSTNPTAPLSLVTPETTSVPAVDLSKPFPKNASHADGNQEDVATEEVAIPKASINILPTDSMSMMEAENGQENEPVPDINHGFGQDALSSQQDVVPSVEPLAAVTEKVSFEKNLVGNISEPELIKHKKVKTVLNKENKENPNETHEMRSSTTKVCKVMRRRVIKKIIMKVTEPEVIVHKTMRRRVIRKIVNINGKPVETEEIIEEPVEKTEEMLQNLPADSVTTETITDHVTTVYKIIRRRVIKKIVIIDGKPVETEEVVEEPEEVTEEMLQNLPADAIITETITKPVTSIHMLGSEPVNKKEEKKKWHNLEMQTVSENEQKTLETGFHTGEAHIQQTHTTEQRDTQIQGAKMITGITEKPQIENSEPSIKVTEEKLSSPESVIYHLTQQSLVEAPTHKPLCSVSPIELTIEGESKMRENYSHTLSSKKHIIIQKRIVKVIIIIDGKPVEKEEVIEEPNDVTDEVLQNLPSGSVVTESVTQPEVITVYRLIRRKIIKNVVIVDGKPVETEEVIEEPEEVTEEVLKNLPPGSVVTRTITKPERLSIYDVINEMSLKRGLAEGSKMTEEVLENLPSSSAIVGPEMISTQKIVKNRVTKKTTVVDGKPVVTEVIEEPEDEVDSALRMIASEVAREAIGTEHDTFPVEEIDHANSEEAMHIDTDRCCNTEGKPRHTGVEEMLKEPHHEEAASMAPTFALPLPDHANDWMELIEGGGFTLDDEDEEPPVSHESQSSSQSPAVFQVPTAEPLLSQDNVVTPQKKEEERDSMIPTVNEDNFQELLKAPEAQSAPIMQPAFGLVLPDHSNDWLEVIESGGFTLDSEDEAESEPATFAETNTLLTDQAVKSSVCEVSTNDVSQSIEETVEEVGLLSKKIITPSEHSTHAELPKPAVEVLTFTGNEVPVKETPSVASKPEEAPAQQDSSAHKKQAFNLPVPDHANDWMEMVLEGRFSLDEEEDETEAAPQTSENDGQSLPTLLEEKAEKIYREPLSITECFPEKEKEGRNELIAVESLQEHIAVSTSSENLQKSVVEADDAVATTKTTELVTARETSVAPPMFGLPIPDHANDFLEIIEVLSEDKILKEESAEVLKTQSQEQSTETPVVPPVFSLPIPDHANDFLEIIEGGGFTLDSESEEESSNILVSTQVVVSEDKILQEESAKALKTQCQEQSTETPAAFPEFGLPIPDHANDFLEIIEGGGFTLDSESEEESANIEEVTQVVVSENKILQEESVKALKTPAQKQSIKGTKPFSYATILSVGKAPTAEEPVAEPKMLYQYQEIPASVLVSSSPSVPPAQEPKQDTDGFEEKRMEKEVLKSVSPPEPKQKSEKVALKSVSQPEPEKKIEKGEDSKSVSLPEPKKKFQEEESLKSVSQSEPDKKSEKGEIPKSQPDQKKKLEKEEVLKNVSQPEAKKTLEKEVLKSVTQLQPDKIIEKVEVPKSVSQPQPEVQCHPSKKVEKKRKKKTALKEEKDEPKKTVQTTPEQKSETVAEIKETQVFELTSIETELADVTLETSVEEVVSDKGLNFGAQTHITDSDVATVQLEVDVTDEKQKNSQSESRELIKDTEISTAQVSSEGFMTSLLSATQVSQHPSGLLIDPNEIILVPQWMRQRPIMRTSSTDDTITTPLEERKRLFKTKSAPLERTSPATDKDSRTTMEEESASCSLVSGEEYYKNKKKRPKKGKAKKGDEKDQDRGSKCFEDAGLEKDSDEKDEPLCQGSEEKVSEQPEPDVIVLTENGGKQETADETVKEQNIQSKEVKELQEKTGDILSSGKVLEEVKKTANVQSVTVKTELQESSEEFKLSEEVKSEEVKSSSEVLPELLQEPAADVSDINDPSPSPKEFEFVPSPREKTAMETKDTHKEGITTETNFMLKQGKELPVKDFELIPECIVEEKAISKEKAFGLEKVVPNFEEALKEAMKTVMDETTETAVVQSSGETVSDNTDDWLHVSRETEHSSAATGMDVDLIKEEVHFEDQEGLTVEEVSSIVTEDKSMESLEITPDESEAPVLPSDRLVDITVPQLGFHSEQDSGVSVTEMSEPSKIISTHQQSSYANILIHAPAIVVEKEPEETKKPYVYRNPTLVGVEEPLKIDKQVTKVDKEGFTQFVSKKERFRRKTHSTSAAAEEIEEAVQSVVEEIKKKDPAKVTREEVLEALCANADEADSDDEVSHVEVVQSKRSKSRQRTRSKRSSKQSESEKEIGEIAAAIERGEIPPKPKDVVEYEHKLFAAFYLGSELWYDVFGIKDAELYYPKFILEMQQEKSQIADEQQPEVKEMTALTKLQAVPHSSVVEPLVCSDHDVLGPSKPVPLEPTAGKVDAKPIKKDNIAHVETSIPVAVMKETSPTTKLVSPSVLPVNDSSIYDMNLITEAETHYYEYVAWLQSMASCAKEIKIPADQKSVTQVPVTATVAITDDWAPSPDRTVICDDSQILKEETVINTSHILAKTVIDIHKIVEDSIVAEKSGRKKAAPQLVSPTTDESLHEMSDDVPNIQISEDLHKESLDEESKYTPLFVEEVHKSRSDVTEVDNETAFPDKSNSTLAVKSIKKEEDLNLTGSKTEHLYTDEISLASTSQSQGHECMLVPSYDMSTIHTAEAEYQKYLASETQTTSWADVVAHGKPITEASEELSKDPEDEKSFILYQTKTIKVLLPEEEPLKPKVPCSIDEEGFTEFVSKQELRRRLRSSCSEEPDVKDIVPYVPRIELPEVEIIEDQHVETQKEPISQSESEAFEESMVETVEIKVRHRRRTDSHRKSQRSRTSAAEKEVDEILRQMSREDVLQKYANYDAVQYDKWQLEDSERIYHEMLAVEVSPLTSVQASQSDMPSQEDGVSILTQEECIVHLLPASSDTLPSPSLTPLPTNYALELTYFPSYDMAAINEAECRYHQHQTYSSLVHSDVSVMEDALGPRAENEIPDKLATGDTTFEHLDSPVNTFSLSKPVAPIQTETPPPLSEQSITCKHSFIHSATKPDKEKTEIPPYSKIFDTLPETQVVIKKGIFDRETPSQVKVLDIVSESDTPNQAPVTVPEVFAAKQDTVSLKEASVNDAKTSDAAVKPEDPNLTKTLVTQVELKPPGPAKALAIVPKLEAPIPANVLAAKVKPELSISSAKEASATEVKVEASSPAKAPAAEVKPELPTPANASGVEIKADALSLVKIPAAEIKGEALSPLKTSDTRVKHSKKQHNDSKEGPVQPLLETPTVSHLPLEEDLLTVELPGSPLLFDMHDFAEAESNYFAFLASNQQENTVTVEVLSNSVVPSVSDVNVCLHDGAHTAMSTHEESPTDMKPTVSEITLRSPVRTKDNVSTEIQLYDYNSIQRAEAEHQEYLAHHSPANTSREDSVVMEEERLVKDANEKEINNSDSIIHEESSFGNYDMNAIGLAETKYQEYIAQQTGTTSWAHVVSQAKAVEIEEEKEEPIDEKSFILYHTKKVQVVVAAEDPRKPSTPHVVDDEGFTEFISKQERRRRLRSSCSDEAEDYVTDIVPYVPRIELPEVEVSEESKLTEFEQKIINEDKYEAEKQFTPKENNSEDKHIAKETSEDSKEINIPIKHERSHKSNREKHHKRHRSRISEAEQEVDDILRQMDREEVLQKNAGSDSFLCNQWIFNDAEKSYYEMIEQLKKDDTNLVSEIREKEKDNDDDDSHDGGYNSPPGLPPADNFDGYYARMLETEIIQANPPHGVANWTDESTYLSLTPPPPDLVTVCSVPGSSMTQTTHTHDMTQTQTLPPTMSKMTLTEMSKKAAPLQAPYQASSTLAQHKKHQIEIKEKVSSAQEKLQSFQERLQSLVDHSVIQQLTIIQTLIIEMKRMEDELNYLEEKGKCLEQDSEMLSLQATVSGLTTRLKTVLAQAQTKRTEIEGRHSTAEQQKLHLIEYQQLLQDLECWVTETYNQITADISLSSSAEIREQIANNQVLIRRIVMSTELINKMLN